MISGRYRRKGANVILHFTLCFCALFVILIAYIGVAHSYNNYDSFTEPCLALADGWTLEDSAGNKTELSLPQTIPFGDDGVYTLSCVLPETEGLLLSPALRFYSNYVDIKVSLDGEPLYSYPQSSGCFNGATGNTYHFIRLPSDYEGRLFSVSIRCQLGSSITYLLKPPLIGSKATMLRSDVLGSLAPIMLSGCMLVLALGLSILYLSMRRQFRLNNATVYTALFALLFAVYVYCETPFAQLFTSNGYLLCFTTLMLLAIMPIPLMGIFYEEVSPRFRPVTFGLMCLCALNLLVQMSLNMAGVMSVRVMLPATHAVIIISILLMALCLFLSGKEDKPSAGVTLLSAVPMIAGGIADIILISVERPSLNNSLWFTLGVTAFISIQFWHFIRSYFALYHSAVESKLLRDMAYRDELTGLGNRNAYERRLKELSEGPISEKLCCIVLDINDLKRINDIYGHRSGDDAIRETGLLLCQQLPECASCFRTGGDEFVMLLDGFDEDSTKRLAQRLYDLAAAQGEKCSIPISLAMGYGQYRPEDGNLIDFIRRVDSRMYQRKHSQKASPDYPFNPEPEQNFSR